MKHAKRFAAVLLVALLIAQLLTGSVLFAAAADAANLASGSYTYASGKWSADGTDAGGNPVSMTECAAPDLTNVPEGIWVVLNDDLTVDGDLKADLEIASGVDLTVNGNLLGTQTLGMGNNKIVINGNAAGTFRVMQGFDLKITGSAKSVRLYGTGTADVGGDVTDILEVAMGATVAVGGNVGTFYPPSDFPTATGTMDVTIDGYIDYVEYYDSSANGGDGGYVTIDYTETPGPWSIKTAADLVTPKECTEHKITWTVTKAATVDATGTKTGKCSICQRTFTAAIEKLSKAEVKAGGDSNAKLAPQGETALPENVVFEAKQTAADKLSAEQQKSVDAIVAALEDSTTGLVGKDQKAGKVDLVCLLNLDLTVQNKDGQGNPLGSEEYHFDGSVKVTVDKPAGLDECKNPCIIHLKDDGTCEKVDYVDNGDGTISFTVNGFSAFAVADVEAVAVEPAEKKEEPAEKKEEPAEKQEEPAEKKEEPAEKKVEPAEKKDVPETGYNSYVGLWVILAVVSVAGVAAMFAFKKQSERK